MKLWKDIRRVAQLVGADRIIPLPHFGNSPSELMALTQYVEMLQSQGRNGSGRPADPEATIPRIVKFRPATWKRLKEEARAQEKLTGRKVSPAQFASMLIEQGLRRCDVTKPSPRRR